MDTYRCEYCDKENVPKHGNKNRFCNLTCWGAWVTQNRTGVNHHSYKAKIERTCEACNTVFFAAPDQVARGWARFCSQKCKKSIGQVERTCLQCEKKFLCTKNQIENIKGGGKFCSKTCVNLWQSTHPPQTLPPVTAGKDHPNWKGGHKSYYGANWFEQRRKARARDNNTCRCCGISGSEINKQLDVHHMKPFREFGITHYLEANQLDNLITLCKHCHMKIENTLPYVMHDLENEHLTYLQLPLELP